MTEADKRSKELGIRNSLLAEAPYHVALGGKAIRGADWVGVC